MAALRLPSPPAPAFCRAMTGFSRWVFSAPAQRAWWTGVARSRPGVCVESRDVRVSGRQDGDIHRHLYLQNATSSVGEMERPKVSEFCCHITGCSQLFDTLESYEHHYNTLHRNVCNSCKRSFPSSHLLDVHIMEWHDSLFQILAVKHNMYQCLIESCTEKFKTSSDRKNHLIKVHGYPSDFRFDKPKKLKCNPKNQERNPQDMEVEATVCQNEANDTFCKATVESMEQEPGETMKAESPPRPEKSGTGKLHQRPPISCRVPTTICFGHGSIRGFKNPRKKK